MPSRSKKKPKSIWRMAVGLSLLAWLAGLVLAPANAGQMLTRQRLAEASPKVVVVFVDGAADWLVEEYLERGVLPRESGFGRLRGVGLEAEYLAPPDASVTAPSFYTQLTGTYPDRHGIVSNRFHAVDQPLSESSSGFDATVEAETLWEAARRQGKRVVCVAGFADGTTPERSCDFTLAYGQAAGRSAVVALAPTGDAAQRWKLGGAKFERSRELQAKPDSPAALGFQLEGGAPLGLYALAADTVADGAERYDTLWLDFDRDLTNGYAAKLGASAWVPVVLPVSDASPAAGAWVKALELAGDLSQVRVYLGAPYRNRGAPSRYLTALESEIGFWPGNPDNDSLGRGLIDEATWFEQAERLSNYIRDAVLFSLRHYDFDLLLTYQPLIDEASHLFLLRDRRQPGYEDEEKRARYAAHIERSYQTVDRNLRALVEAASRRARFVIASDHGMVPVHTRVAVNALLAQAGFRLARDDTAEVRAYTSASTAHIYVNLAGRERGGVVAREELSAYVERIVGACRQLRGPGGEPVFDYVLTREELNRVRLGHPERAGDVWVNARPGYTLSGSLDTEQPVLAPVGGGQHGYAGAVRPVRAIFFAAGPGIPHLRVKPMRSVDVAATVSALLEIDSPAQNEGQAVVGRKE
ncbi:MAG: alkaline phosphatase family protein [Acidobacteria bacterium]|nr:alkaline phosphatase family protein [Acidobacteriota bacterium]